jgi:hypothetical protein
VVTNLGLNIGQGVFRLDAGLSDLPGARLEQFNRSSQNEAVPGEQNADFIVVALPLAELRCNAGEVFKLGALVGGPGFVADPPVPARELDRSFLGADRSGSGMGTVVLEGLEVRLGPDLDPDGDGLTLADETAWATEPDNPDTDADGLPDGWEVSQGLDPHRTDGRDGAQGDPDRDGMANAAEFLAGTHPGNPFSRLRLNARSLADGHLELHWTTIPGKRYRLEHAAEISGPFAPLEPHNGSRPANAREVRLMVDALRSGREQRWFRLVVLP